jgi:signal peptidase I
MGPLLPYRTVRRGDVVVFLSPAEPGLYLVKRVIGIPGDRIHLHEGEVYRNGEKLSEAYVMHKAADIPKPFRDEFPAVAPSGTRVGVARGRALGSDRAEVERRRSDAR